MIWKTLERFLLPKMKYFYTVSDGYAKWFQKEYQVKPTVIRNVPQLQKLNNDAKLSDVATTVTTNYSTYYECAVKNDA